MSHREVTDGADGAPGVGVPTGGTAGQVLTKDSGTDYDTSWEDSPSTAPSGTGLVRVTSDAYDAPAELSGDVTTSGTLATTIANNAVTTAKINDGAVTEAKQTLADNTTGNVSTSAHGYAPKGDGSTTKFLNANGAYSTPAGTGGSVANLPIDAAAIAAVGSGDLFAGTSLDGGWSDLQTTAWSTTDRSVDGYLIAKNSGSTSGLDRGKQRPFSPAADFEVWTKIPWATMVADFHWTGLFVGATDPSDAAGGNRLQYFLIRNTKIALKAAKIASGVETVVPGISSVGIDDPTLLPEANRNSAVQPFPAWLRIKRVGSTISFGICWDGVEFIDLTSTTTIAFTVNTIGLLHASNTDTRKTRAVFQYIATTG